MENNEHTIIQDLKADERPRERLMQMGASALRDAELLAILIGSGSRTENAVHLMERLLVDHNNSLNEVGKMSLEQLQRYKGIGEAKAISILAACELGKRRQEENVEERPKVRSSEDIYKHFLNKLRDVPIEECHVLLLNQNLRIIGSTCIARGGITGTIVDVRIALREAILAHATAIALCHNHPSGNARPSLDDDRLTKKIKQAAEAIDIRFIDHIVLADGRYYSYSDEGKI